MEWLIPLFDEHIIMSVSCQVLLWLVAVVAVAGIVIGISFSWFASDDQPAASVLDYFTTKWRHVQKTDTVESGTQDHQMSNSHEGNESPSESSSFSSTSANSDNMHRSHYSRHTSSTSNSLQNASLKKKILKTLLYPFRALKRATWDLVMKLSRRQPSSSRRFTSPRYDMEDPPMTAPSPHAASTPRQSNNHPSMGGQFQCDWSSLAAPISSTQRTRLKQAADKLHHMLASSHQFRGNVHHIQSMVTPQFVFRYFDSMDWATDYHGLRYDQTRLSTILST